MSLFNYSTNSFVSGELSPKGIGRDTLEAYGQSIKTGLNCVVQLLGGVTRRPGFQYISILKNQAKIAELFSFVFDAENAYIIEAGDQYLRFYKNKAQIYFSGNPYEVSTPYLEADVPQIQTAQSLDVMYMSHPSYKIGKLIRKGDSDWEYSAIDLIDGPYLPENNSSITLTPSASTGNITVTASSALFTSTDVGRLIRYKSGEDLSRQVTYTATGTQKNFDIPFFPQEAADIQVYIVNTVGVRGLAINPTDYTVASGQVVFVNPPTANHLVQIRPANAASGRWGYMRITGYTSATQVSCTVLRDLGGINPSVYWRLGAFSQTTGYPRAIAFFEDRLWLTNDGNTIYGSVVGDYETFKPDDDNNKGTPSATSGVSFTLISNSNQIIQWLFGKQYLIAGTSTSITSLLTSAGQTLSAITPPSIRKDIDVECMRALPVGTDSDVVFIQENGKRLSRVNYSFERDGYTQVELNLLAGHVSQQSKFKKIVGQEYPLNLVWALTESGKLSTLVLNTSQNVNAWTRQEIGGTNAVVESIASIPSTTGNTQLWAIIRRTINGQTKRYVEVLSDFFDTNNGDTIYDAYFTDSWIRYNGVKNTTLTLSNATIGDSRTFTAGSNVFTNTDVGRNIRTENGYAVVTGYTSPTVVTCKIQAAFESTSIASGSWYLMSTEFTGLDHLEGEYVFPLADGKPHPVVRVTSGKITLQYSAGIVNVGLPTSMQVDTLPISTVVGYGTTKNLLSRVQSITIRLHETVGLSYTVSDAYSDVNFLEPTQLSDKYIPLFTGLKSQGVIGYSSNELILKFRNSQPLPCTILNITAVIEVPDRLS